jgi:hypothetical protein
MEAVREKWTDERMDDLNDRVTVGFSEMRTEFRAVRSEAQTEFAAVRSEMNSRFDAVDAKFAAQNRMLIQMFGGMLVAMLVGFLGVVAAVITQT